MAVRTIRSARVAVFPWERFPTANESERVRRMNRARLEHALGVLELPPGFAVPIDLFGEAVR